MLAGATGPGRELSGVDLSTIVRGHRVIRGATFVERRDGAIRVMLHP